MILAVIVAVSTAAGVSSFLMGILNRQNFTSRLNKVNSSSFALRERIRVNLADQQIWTTVLADSANASLFSCQGTSGPGCCTKNSTGPCTPRTGNLRIIDPHAAIKIDGSYPTNGLTYDGSPCNNYGKGACVFRPRVTWTALCPNELCQFPLDQLKITIDFTDPTGEIQINPEAHSTVIVRNTLLGDPNGVMKRILANIGTCADGSGLSGIDKSGNPICTPY